MGGSVAVRPYVFRIVVPRRDVNRVKWFFKIMEERGIKPVYTNIQSLFEQRRDLDVVEAIYVVTLERRERRKLERELARSLRGSIGFFVVHLHRSTVA